MLEKIKKQYQTDGASKLERYHQLIVFKIEQQEYALPIDQVKEVVITPSIAKVPLTPNYVLGVANIRGSIFAILDLALRFQLKQADAVATYNEQKTYTLVLAHEELQVGLLVQEVPSTLSVSEKNIELSPHIVQDYRSKKDNIKGIAKLSDRIVLLLNIEAVINPEDFEIAEGAEKIE